MSNVNLIQNKIMQLEGGAFQILFDEYLYKKYKLKNIQTLGVQTGTNKPTKGIPDSYVLTSEGKYILINYGSVSSQPAEKIKEDILACFNAAKLLLSKDKIEKIICGYCSTNIHIEQFENIRECIEGVKIELIGIDTLSHDLACRYPHIAKNQLGISIDTNQFFDVEDFVKAYDANGINAPLDCKFLYRIDEMDNVIKSIEDNRVTVLAGPSGIGKTRLAIEVCQYCGDENYKVYCVRSNGNLLYEDIRYYIDNPGSYLIFFDDANMVVSWDNTLNTLLTLSGEYKIKILITLRDYAKERVIRTISRYTEPKIIEIKAFTDEEVKGILKSDLGIQNSNYINRIVEISNGNIRLAFLAGIKSIDKGYQAIRNVEDIFRNYYGRIVEDTDLSKEDIIMLFLIAVAGPIRYSENRLFNELKNQYSKNVDVDETIRKLYSVELIDWFRNEIVKISDQSLGNFILYYVLFEKRWVTIEELIESVFPQYRRKIIYVLRTLMEIFDSKEVVQYVETSIISAWDNAPNSQKKEYLEAFYVVDLDRALCIIKENIDNEKNIDFDLHNLDISKNRKHGSIETKEIEILSGYKHTEYFEDAFELMLLYFSKRPDLVIDFYSVITECLIFDKNSWKDGYRRENILLDKMWIASKEGESYNYTILYLYVAQYALKTEFSYTEEVRNSKSINFVRMTINFSKGIAALREKIWRTLGMLRIKDEYRLIINDILGNIHFKGLDKKNSEAYLQSDFDAIISYIIINKNKPDFFNDMIIDNYRKNAGQVGVSLNEVYLNISVSYEFKVYKMFMSEHLNGRPIDDDEKFRREFIAKEVHAYGLSDYKRLFRACRFLEKTVYEKNQWYLNTGLDIVFELAEDNKDMYVQVMEEYFNENAPFRINECKRIKRLLHCIGYERTYKLISNREYSNRENWIAAIWECLEPEYITTVIVNDYKEFIINNIDKENAIAPSIYALSIYGEKDEELKIMILEKAAKNTKVACNFLSCVYRDTDIELLMHIFKNRINILSNIYLNAIKGSNYIDYDGKLFKKIFELRPIFWDEYIVWMKHNNCEDEYGKEKIELIWGCDSWKKCMEYAFNILIHDERSFCIEQPVQLLFGKDESVINEDRKKQWLIGKLHENINDIKMIKVLINIVATIIPDWEVEYLLEFLKENNKIDDFKKINLFSMSSSWSGSEIPLILDKIEFLRLLKTKLKGIEFIGHRNYLEEYCRKLERYKKEVELREYLENEDYA